MVTMASSLELRGRRSSCIVVDEVVGGGEDVGLAWVELALDAADDPVAGEGAHGAFEGVDGEVGGFGSERDTVGEPVAAFGFGWVVAAGAAAGGHPVDDGPGAFGGAVPVVGFDDDRLLAVTGHQLTSPLSAVATSLAWRRLASEPSPNVDGNDSTHSSLPRVTAMPPKSRDRRSHESRDSRSGNRSTPVSRPSTLASSSSRAPDIDRVSRTDETDRPSSSSMATTSSA